MSILKAENICKVYNNKTIIQDISIHLEEGELVSLLGVSGAGKTTLFNVLSGLTTPDKGQVFLENDDITGKPGKVSYMLQKDMLFSHKKIIDNVALPLLIKGLPKDKARIKALEYFDNFGLVGTEDMYPCQLSGGMKQRAALLRTYLTSSRVALLDEPFSALDTITKTSIHSWYLDIMEKIRLSTLFITHDIDEAILLSDRIYILKGQPGTITDEIIISSPKPRNADFSLSIEFLEYKKQIISKLS